MTIKNKGGRPKKSSTDKLVKHSYSLNPIEAKALRKRCKELKMPLAVYVRNLVAQDVGLKDADNDNK